MLRFIISCICCLLLPTEAMASDDLTLSITQWTFDNVQAKNIRIDIKLTSKGLGAIIHADSLQLPPPIGRITALKLQCDELLMQTEQFSCIKGKIAFHQPQLDQQSVAFKFVAIPDEQRYQVVLTSLSSASTKFVIEAELANKNWRATIDMPDGSLTSFFHFLLPHIQEEYLNTLDEWNVNGNVGLSAQLSGQRDTLNKLNVKISGKSLNISNNDGQYVMENTGLILMLNLDQQKQRWQWQTKLSINDGQGYGEPIFIDFNATPISLQADIFWQQSAGKLQITNAKLKQQSIMQISGHFIGNLDRIDQLDVVVEKTDIRLLYQNWLQPFLVGTSVNNLALAGKVRLQYHQRIDDYHLTLDINKLFVDDATGRFSFDDVSGIVGWTNYTHTMMTDLQWQGGHVYSIPIGKSRLQAKVHASILTLTKPWKLPILDGELQLNGFSLERPDEAHTQWSFDGLLTPISMESLSSTLAWPLLHGKLSGVIPKVSYAEQHIQMDGALMVKLFDGTTVIRDLHLDHPFGTLPQLYANVDLTGLDLEILTQTFDFGRITGKLDGTIKNIRLSNWQPVQFDAKFATPEGDKSRRRISQKAIDNLSYIGGGASGTLSRGFLRLFKDFSYQRLGLSCQLRNEVCEMSGVGEAKQGYYIVKGGGLPPRINVVGYTRRVNWPDLIERLKIVSDSSEPIVR